MWATVSTVLAFLWWGFWLSLLAYVIVTSLWERRPWRRDYQDMLNAHMAQLASKFEREQLAKMEGEGAELWKPDPDQLKARKAR